ncbi:hypothetical protein A4H97_19525 [Niastella yeongjuensis]|uniref:Uncharacterized protein n=1 Tax=Niastella yeongjuensis TaxID=354355 RepID=A0A1V9DYE2_9BACT|nr:hypothetical protein [Niastella yeongjuensis]OQP38896.1 hypothetical protein A4H97_19525 [Niastella yeongjuensis]SEO28623.1 hypothetical protein SAMN05660816_02496 [Niastella yeongjuensis]
MDIRINNVTITKIDTSYNSLEELATIEKLYFNILCKIFLNRPVIVLTIAPQENYSIGYDFSSVSEFKLGKTKYLINQIDFCPSSILQDISESEEFARGLLLLFTDGNILSENIDEIIKYVHNNLGLENLTYEIARCENDGRILCLYNSKISNTELQTVINSTLSNLDL